MAAEKTFNKLVLGGKKLSIRWAYSQAKQLANTAAPKFPRQDPRFDPIPGLPEQLPLPPNPNDYFNLSASDMILLPPGMKLTQIPQFLPNAPGPSGSGIHYQSQDPNRLGALKK